MMDDSLATARAILVGGAVLTLVVSLAIGQWFVAGVMAVGVTAHTIHIILHRRETAAAAAAGSQSDAPTG